MEEEADSITDLQRQIESQLEKDGNKKRLSSTGKLIIFLKNLNVIQHTTYFAFL